MSTKTEDKSTGASDSKTAQAYVINEKGEEIPITDEMVAQSMAEVKLNSIGAHTGFNKVITDDMLPPEEE